MAKFVIECPQCGKSVEASNFIFAKKKIPCSCGHVIDVKAERLSSKICPHCGNTVVYDQSKGEKAKCPVCHELINTTANRSVLSEFTCPTCSCKLSADKNASMYDCPLCGTKIDVQERIAKERVKDEGIISVIKYEGKDNFLVWKHPVEDFNMGSQLIVHESQEAIFFRDGKALDLFGPGRHTLSTQNLPGLKNLYKLSSNTTDYFHSEVYFINVATIMGVKWGTDSKVTFIEPVSKIPFELGASGEFNIRVEDSRKLLIKVVGTADGFTTSDVIQQTGSIDIKSMSGKFRALIMNRVKSHLAKSIRENSISIFETDEHMDVLSTHLQGIINEGLKDYGLTLPEFYITNIITPDDDPNYRRMKQQYADRYLKTTEQSILRDEAIAAAEVAKVKATTAADVTKIEAEAKAEAYRLHAAAEADEMHMKGYTYQHETARQVGVGAVTNEHGGGSAGGSNIGGVIGDIAEASIGLGVVKEVFDMTKGALNPMPNPFQPNVPATPVDSWDCACGAKGVTSEFCGKCGARRPSIETWDCACGAKGVTSEFCGKCGARRPSIETWDCACGAKGITSEFCGRCGTKRPSIETWDCACGAKGITSEFCGKCGTKRPSTNTWDCACGAKGITSEFCGKCGTKKPVVENGVSDSNDGGYKE